MEVKRTKRVSFDQDGEVHEYTFSTYRRQPFLLRDDFRRVFLDKLKAARKKHGFLVWAYVLMPNHVHLLIPARRALTRSILKSVKQATAQTIVAQLKMKEPDMLLQMASGARRGDSPYSFWQVGGGYDRNVEGPKEYWGLHRIHPSESRAERTC